VLTGTAWDQLGDEDFKDIRSDGRCIYDCQTVGVNLTIPDGLGVNKRDA